MFQLPAVCSTCGTIFPSGMAVANSRDMTFQGNTAGPCPKCGGMGKVIDGTFDFVGNSVKVKKAPQTTIDVLNILQNAMELARSGSSQEEVISKISEASPDLGEKATTIYSRGGLPMLILFIFFLLQQCTGNTSGKIDYNILFDQFLVAATDSEPYPSLSALLASKETGLGKQDPQSQTVKKSERSKQKTPQKAPPPSKPSNEIEYNASFPPAVPLREKAMKNHQRKNIEKQVRRKNFGKKK